MPNMKLAGKQKSAIYPKINDTLETLLNCSPFWNSDTDIISIAQSLLIVNPYMRK